MAQNFLQRRLKNLFLVLVLTTAIYLAKAVDLKETTLSLYFQDISAPDATNATVIPVAGIAGKPRTFTQFGTVFVIDDYITEGPDPKSPEVGHAQGMYVTAGLDGLNSHVMISIVFTNKEYSKSTLEIQGVSKQIEAIREVSMVSGTGKFRFARGYVTFETYSFHVPTCHAVIRCNVTLVDSIKGMDPRLVEAALNGNTIELQRLLGEDSLLLERDSLAVYPETALHIATMGGQTEFVRELLKLKPDFATRLDKNGLSAIHIASANGFVETVRELLKFARLKSSDGRTSLHCAAVTGRVQVIRELLGSFPDCMEDLTPRDETALHLTVKYNQFEAFKAMFDVLKQLNMQEIMSAGDEDGYTVLHLAVARKQIQTVKLLLGSNGRQQEIIDVNVTNKSGFTALDVSDVIQQMGVGEPADFIIRDLLLRAGALRASELEDVHTAQVHRKQISVTAPLPPQTLWPFLLHEILLLNPWRFWKLLAKEVKKTPPETLNALLVVAVLIATMTYQAILSPPSSVFDGNYVSGVLNLQEFDPFMLSNSIGFFASLAVIILVMDGFPLKALMGIAVRCLAASYLCALLMNEPTSGKDSHLNAVRCLAANYRCAIIGIIVLVDLARFIYWLIKRWSKEYIRNRRTF